MKEGEREDALPKRPELAPLEVRAEPRTAGDRCPFCHDTVDPSSRARCSSCQALHHFNCLGSARRRGCTVCGGEVLLVGSTSAPSPGSVGFVGSLGTKGLGVLLFTLPLPLVWVLSEGTPSLDRLGTIAVYAVVALWAVASLATVLNLLGFVWGKLSRR